MPATRLSPQRRAAPTSSVPLLAGRGSTAFFRPSRPARDRVQRQEAGSGTAAAGTGPRTLPDEYDRRLDWFEMSRPFTTRGAESMLHFDSRMYFSIGNAWSNNYNLFFRFGLGDSLSADAANFFTPFAIDAALKYDFPSASELFERNADISSLVISPTVFSFDLHDIPGTLRLPFLKVFGVEQRNPYVPLQRRCADRADDGGVLQRSEVPGATSVPASFESGLARAETGGDPLPDGTRQLMEGRLGADFGEVRTHRDDGADRLSRQIRAQAFTHGNHIYFGAGQYDPNSSRGKRLLAHELTHVVQQSGGKPPALQREEKEAKATAPTERVDVALLLDDSEVARVEAQTYAPIVIRATNSEDAKRQLKALGRPIRTLFVVSHSNRLGEVQVVSGIGTISWTKLADFSKDLKGALPAEQAPETVDFRGCKLGEAPSEMEAFRQNIAATAARASNCWSFAATVTPLTAPDGSEITSVDKIPAGIERQFDQALRVQISGLKSEDGRSVKDCITGLATGERADKKFGKIREIYFRNGGHLSAGWVSPDFNERWQQGSRCVKDLTETSSPCKLVITK